LLPAGHLSLVVRLEYLARLGFTFGEGIGDLRVQTGEDAVDRALGLGVYAFDVPSDFGPLRLVLGLGGCFVASNMTGNRSLLQMHVPDGYRRTCRSLRASAFKEFGLLVPDLVRSLRGVLLALPLGVQRLLELGLIGILQVLLGHTR